MKQRSLRKLLVQFRYWIISGLAICAVLYFTGWSEHPRATSYFQDFSWPLDRPDFKLIADNIINQRPLDPHLEVINPFNHDFIIKNQNKCQGDVDLVILIKSRLENNHHRHVIRETWGDEFRFKNKSIKRVFFVGSCNFYGSNMITSCLDRVKGESVLYGDIVQVDFQDTYFNATLKTTSMYKWLVDYCGHASHAFFADDDFYVSMRNLLKYLKNPIDDKYNKLPDGLIPFDGRLYSGWVARGRRPNRVHSSKWYVSLQEYPFDYYPDFIAGGAYVVSNSTFNQIQAAMQFVKPFAFEDTFLSFIAKKLDLKLIHNKRFINDDRDYEEDNFGDIIAFHAKGDYLLSKRIWDEQNARGVA